jgi:hypothetical protein
VPAATMRWSGSPKSLGEAGATKFTTTLRDGSGLNARIQPPTLYTHSRKATEAGVEGGHGLL